MANYPIFEYIGKLPDICLMIAIITGDIINSRKKSNQKKWLPLLKSLLNLYGKTPSDWQIYRGDSFQLKITNATLALKVALHLKAGIKTLKDKDVRLAIGLGKEDVLAKNITEANGSAYMRSGEIFEQLKDKKINLAVNSGKENFDENINLLLQFASLTIDKWSISTAEIVKLYLEQPSLSQLDLAKKMNRSQSSISERQRRAQLDLLIDLEKYFAKKVGELS